MPNILGNDKIRSVHLPSTLLPPQPASMAVDALFSVPEQRSNPLATLPAQNDLKNSNDVGLASIAALSATGSPISSEEDYVPSITSRVIEASILNGAAENTNHNGLIPEIGPLPTGEGIVPHTNSTPMQSVELDMIDNDPGNIGANETASGPDLSLPVAEPSDSDDYEPPEPALTVDASTEPLTEPLIEPSTLPSAVVDKSKSLFPSSTSVLEPLSEPMELSPALPVNGERSVIITESASPEQLTVRFFPTYSINLTLLSGHQHACGSRNKILCALRKPAEEVQIISIPSRISSRCSARFPLLNIQSWH